MRNVVWNGKREKLDRWLRAQVMVKGHTWVKARTVEKFMRKNGLDYGSKRANITAAAHILKQIQQSPPPDTVAFVWNERPLILLLKKKEVE